MRGLLIVILCIFFIASAGATTVTQNLTVEVIEPKNVVINEFESNPLGANANNQWVELYNNESVDVNISGWQIYDGLGLGAPQVLLTIPSQTAIPSKGFYTANLSGSRLNSGGDFLTLKNSFDIEIDQTPTLADTDNDNLTWQRVPDARDNWVFKEETRNFTNNLIFIEDKTSAPSCILETDNVTLSVNVTGSCIEEVTFSVFLNESWTNITGTQSGDIYSTIIPPELLPSSEIINWTVYVRDCSNNLAKNGDEMFKVNSRTSLAVSPPSPTGLNGWYLEEPTFTLMNSDGNISYRWNGEAFQDYAGPFGLEDTPNDGDVTGGIHVLKYRSDACGEEEREFVGKFDFTDPLITNLFPADGSEVHDDPTIIQALLDEIYQGNSGIDKGSVTMILDGGVVPANVTDSGDLDAIVKYDPALVLGEGLHVVNLSVSDNSGRHSSKLWNFTIDTTTGFGLTVNEPQEKVYNTKRVSFNLTTTKEVKEISYINSNDRRPRERRLCRDCDEYGETRKRTKTLSEGQNNLTFLAVDEFNDVEMENVTLFVDSRDPRIRKTEPTRGFTFGNFSLEFDELNPEILSLHYGNPGTGFRIHVANISSDCILDRRYECSVWINLSDYDGQEIEYFFNLTDIAKNDDQSRTRDLDVDMTAPIANSFNHSIDGRRTSFIFNITEINFDKITYINNLDDRPRERTLCRRLDDQICEKRVSFGEGMHQLDFRITDKAGNSVLRNISFFIDSKPPKISRTEPRRGEFTNGSMFSVRYSEDNLQSVILMFNPNVTFQNCTSGRNQICGMDINLSLFDNSSIEYFFEISDGINTVRSRLTEVKVDTTSPELEIHMPENDTTYGRRVPFNITTSEKGIIEYWDWFDSRPRWRRLCSRCDEYGSSRRKIRGLRIGTHDVMIRARDGAGNSDVKNIVFNVV